MGHTLCNQRPIQSRPSLLSDLRQLPPPLCGLGRGHGTPMPPQTVASGTEHWILRSVSHAEFWLLEVEAESTRAEIPLMTEARAPKSLCWATEPCSCMSPQQTQWQKGKSPFWPLPCFSEVSAQTLSCTVPGVVPNRQWLSPQELPALLSIPNEWPGPVLHPPPCPSQLCHQSQASIKWESH